MRLLQESLKSRTRKWIFWHNWKDKSSTGSTSSSSEQVMVGLCASNRIRTLCSILLACMLNLHKVSLEEARSSSSVCNISSKAERTTQLNLNNWLYRDSVLISRTPYPWRSAWPLPCRSVQSTVPSPPCCLRTCSSCDQLSQFSELRCDITKVNYFCVSSSQDFMLVMLFSGKHSVGELYTLRSLKLYRVKGVSTNHRLP